MKALVQIVTCTSDHRAFVIVPVVRSKGEVDDWAVCNDNVVDPVIEAGYNYGICDQCGDRAVRAEYVCCVDDSMTSERAEQSWNDVLKSCDVDKYGRARDNYYARDVLADCVGCDDADLATSVCAVFPGLVDGETPVNGADLVDFLTRKLRKG